MAVPVITAVSPATIETMGGELVTLTGTSFGPKVRVTFNGVVSPWVVVADAGARVFAVTPKGNPPAPLQVANKGAAGNVVPATIVVQNLNSSGAVIAGESVTNAALVTWTHPDYVNDGPLARVTRTLIQSLKLEMMAATAPDSTAVDFDDVPDDTNRTVVIAEAPSLSLGGPRLVPNGLYRDNTRRYSSAGNSTFAAHAPSVAYDLLFTVTLAARGKIQLLNMTDALIRFTNRAIRLYMDRTAGNATTRSGWRMTLGEIRSAVPRAGLHVATADLTVVGFTPDMGQIMDATRVIETIAADPGPKED